MDGDLAARRRRERASTLQRLTLLKNRVVGVRIRPNEKEEKLTTDRYEFGLDQSLIVE